MLLGSFKVESVGVGDGLVFRVVQNMAEACFLFYE